MAGNRLTFFTLWSKQIWPQKWAIKNMRPRSMWLCQSWKRHAQKRFSLQHDDITSSGRTTRSAAFHYDEIYAMRELRKKLRAEAVAKHNITLRSYKEYSVVAIVGLLMLWVVGRGVALFLRRRTGKSSLRNAHKRGAESLINHSIKIKHLSTDTHSAFIDAVTRTFDVSWRARIAPLLPQLLRPKSAYQRGSTKTSRP